MSILNEIVAHKKLEVATLTDCPKPPVCKQDFTTLWSPSPCLIAEIKARSPSEGTIVEEFHPLDMADQYNQGGANAISVLTDDKYFGGSFGVLKSVRAVTNKPLLCKEFIIDAIQIRVARNYGADLILLIVKILDPETLRSLKSEVELWGMKALIEVQNIHELNLALQVSPEFLLINNRDLNTFFVDTTTTHDLLAAIPAHIKVIAASGIKNPSEIHHFSKRVNGFLIGTALMRSKNPVKFLAQCR